jgi:general secretion pathway protein H
LSARLNQRGVTLLELLVVMAILALTASIIVLSAPPPQGPAKAEAERFAVRLIAASEEAIIAGKALRLDLSPTDYRFLAFAEGEWKPVAGAAFLAERRISSDVLATIEIEDPALANEAPATRPQDDPVRRILLDPVGLVVPFVVDFADRNERWQVRQGADGRVEVRPYGRQ